VLKIAIDIKGRAEMERAIRVLGGNGPKAMAAALWNEGTRIMNQAKDLVPVDTTALQGSGMVDFPVISGSDVSVKMGFGGAASAYAKVQHEELSYYHKPPTQAKYLEQPLREAAEDMGFRLAKELWDELK
jgi:cation transport ATPase